MFKSYRQIQQYEKEILELKAKGLNIQKVNCADSRASQEKQLTPYKV